MGRKAIYVLFVAAFVVINAVEIPFGIRINGSESLPQRVFLSRIRKNAPERGDIVSFKHPLEEKIVAKEIAGLPGDEIRIEKGRVFVNDLDIGDVITDKMHPIAEGVIGEGFLFARGKHERSFDSRYAEFGLVPIACIREVLWPIF